MNLDKVADNTITEILKTVSHSISDAVKTYGPDAVDLALVAYQVSAIQTLIVGFAFVVALIVTAIAYKKLWYAVADLNEEDRGIILLTSGFFVIFLSGWFVIAAFLNLTSVPIWLAAFGYPEVLIATKALIAAGLL